MRRCLECGNPHIMSDHNFCWRCGADLRKQRKEMKTKVKVEYTVSFDQETFTSEEADIEVLDEEEGNKFLNISLKDNLTSRSVSIVISTDDLKKILGAVFVEE